MKASTTSSSGARAQPGTLAFTLLGIPVAVSPLFWLVTWVLAGRWRSFELIVEWAAVVFVSVLVHELGHALMARRFGRSARIELHGMGGTAFHLGAELSHGQRILVSLAGPFAGVLLGAAVYAVQLLLPSPLSHFSRQVIYDALWANWGYGLMNLLPILPLDGGQATQSLIDWVTKRKDHPAGVIVSLVAAAGLLAWSLYADQRAGLFLLVWLLVFQAQRFGAVVGDWRDRRRKPDLERLSDVFARHDWPALISGAEELLRGAVGSRTRAHATHMIACGHFFQDHYAETIEALRRMPEGYVRDPWMLGVSFQELGDERQAAECFRQAWAAQPSADLATRYCRALVADGQLDEALRFALSLPPEHLTETALHVVSAGLFLVRRYQDSLRLSALGFERFRSPREAVNAACAHARLNEPARALEWLERAVDAGWTDAAGLQQDEDLASLSDLPGFQALLARLAPPSTAS